MKLDLSPLKKAISQRENSLVYCESDLAEQDTNLALQLRAGAIQAFEFTYELCWTMLKRYLKITESNASDLDRLSLLKTSLEESILPYRVDLIDLCSIDNIFKEVIDKEKS